MPDSTIFEQAADTICNGDETRLAELLVAHVGLAQARSERDHRATLLHYTAANGIEAERQRTPPNIVSIARRLLDAGADPDATAVIYGGGCASTPLALVVSSEHPAHAGKQAELVQVYCQYGASPNGIDSDSYPLLLAIAGRYTEAILALQAAGANTEHLVFAAVLGQFEEVQQMVRGVITSLPDLNGGLISDETALRGLALTSASMAGHAEIVQVLLRSGAELDGRYSLEDGTALHEASRTGQTEIVRYLLQRGANVGIQDKHGQTPLHGAAWNVQLEIVRLLLAAGAPLEVQNRWGETVLGSTVRAYVNTPYPSPDHAAILEALILAGADVAVVSPYPTGDSVIDRILAQYR